MPAIRLALALILFSASAGIISQAAAQGTAQNLPCSTATTTADMSLCEQQRFDAAERDLQSVYKRVLDQSPVQAKIKLRAAEAAWLVYRKAESDFQASAAEGGALAPLLRVTSLADLTERRSGDLKKALHP